MSNYIRSKLLGGCYFFTVVTYCRRKFRTDDLARQYLRRAIIATSKNYPFKIDAWVRLPNHLHCIWTLPKNDDDYSTRWKNIKNHFTHHAKAHYHNPEWMTPSKIKKRESTLWQRRAWEHTIRDDRDYTTHFDYSHYNPVKHDYVTHPQHWLYSTYHRYRKLNDYPADWGTSPPDFNGDFGDSMEGGRHQSLNCHVF